MERKKDDALTDRYFDEPRSSPVKWVPILLAISAFLVAAFFADSEDPNLKRLAGAWFGYGLGFALVFWGIFNVREGRIRGRSRHYYRNENPRTFGFLMLLKNIIPAICCFTVAIIYTLGIPG